MDNCIFCKIVKGEVKGDIVLEGDNFIAFKDVNPKTEGHTLIVPREHFVNLMEIPDDYGNELLSFIKSVSEKLIDEGFGDGFNVIMNNGEVAGQVVGHVHIHVLPRKKGDGLKMVC